MIRACLGTNLRSTSQVAQYNEAICKVICHNLRVLGRAIHEEDISPTFETVASYVARIEEASRALVETIAGGRIAVPRRTRRRGGGKPELTVAGESLEESGGKSRRQLGAKNGNSHGNKALGAVRKYDQLGLFGTTEDS